MILAKCQVPAANNFFSNREGAVILTVHMPWSFNRNSHVPKRYVIVAESQIATYIIFFFFSFYFHTFNAFWTSIWLSNF